MMDEIEIPDTAIQDALLASASIWGPWAAIALPAGLFLVAAAPAAGRGFGEWVGSWFRARQMRLE